MSKDGKTISLHPIPYREVLRDLLQVKPEPKPERPKTKRKKSVLNKHKAK
jgi:hypothetical protein